MRNRRFQLLAVTAALALTAAVPAYAEEGREQDPVIMEAAGSQGETGWLLSDGVWFYRENGNYVRGWKQIGEHWYYFNPDSSEMEKGVKDIDGYRYILDPADGDMKTGWYQHDGDWYYMDESGIMQMGWAFDGSSWYRTSPEDGKMQTGWYSDDHNWYYMETEKGRMQTGWYNVNDKWYYSDANGAMAQNRWVEDRYVDESGAMVTNMLVGDAYVGADGRKDPNFDFSLAGAQWVQEDGNWYYRLENGSSLKGMMKNIGGHRYLFDADGKMQTGWHYVDGYKYYFNESGQLMEDLDGILPIQSSYEISVNRAQCQVMVYAADGANGYTIPVKTFLCSVGKQYTPTPVGVFHSPAKYRWQELMGPSYGQYCTRITGHVLFHSVAGRNMTSHNLSARQYNKLGSPASHGCVRLNVRDAKWIYDNCPLGTTIRISDTEPLPFSRPAQIIIPQGQNWDPTDPNV